MKKRGNISLEMVAVAAIVLFVVIVIIFIFGKQIRESAGGFFDIETDARQQASGERCGGLLMTGRTCVTGDCPSGYDPVIKPGNVEKWTDCDKSGQQCCEKSTSSTSDTK